MDMCMRHLQPHNHYSHFLHEVTLFESLGYFLCEHVHASEFIVFEIEIVVHLSFGYDERMPFRKRIYIQESEKLIVLRNFIAGDLSATILLNTDAICILHLNFMNHNKFSHG